MCTDSFYFKIAPTIDEDMDEDNLLKQALIYLLDSDRADGYPNDAVAKFHLGNGAILERVNLNSDLSSKGIKQSRGIMFNYLYDLDLLEKNHELFFKTKKVQQSDEIKSLRKNSYVIRNPLTFNNTYRSV